MWTIKANKLYYLSDENFRFALTFFVLYTKGPHSHFFYLGQHDPLLTDVK